MRLKNIKKIRGKNAVDTSYGLNGCAECKARILSMSAGLGVRGWMFIYGLLHKFFCEGVFSSLGESCVAVISAKRL